MASQEGLRQRFRAIPKAEIHLHLEGSIDIDTLWRIVQRHGTPEGGAEAARQRLAALYRHRDFPHFLSNFRDLCSHLRTPEDFALATGSLCERLQSDGVRYAEVFCSPQIFARVRGLAPLEILAAISAEARAREAAGGPRLRFLLDGVRQFGVGGLEELVEIATDARLLDVIGIGVGGDESVLPTAEFSPVYREARRRGLHRSVHAGEFAGPRSVWEAMEILEAERIGHGVRAHEDAVLVRALARARLPLECCPTSNIRTGVVRDWRSHPLRLLHDAGVQVTVNSDDPAMFDSGVADEWVVLVDRLGFSERETLEVGMRTVGASFMPDDGKTALVEEMLRAAAREGIA